MRDIYVTLREAVSAASESLDADASLDQVMLLPAEVPLGMAIPGPEGKTLIIRCLALMPDDWHIMTRDGLLPVIGDGS